MATSRQIQVMRIRVMEKLDDILSQQKTIIATINAMSCQVKKRADSVLKSVKNDVNLSDYVDVLQDLERCFNNLIAISATTDDLFSFTSVSNPFSNSNHSQVDSVFIPDPKESDHLKKKWTPLDSEMSDVTDLSSPVRDISSISHLVSAAPFIPKKLLPEEPYDLGPELKYQRVESLMNVQVCETITPYCFWVQFSETIHLLQELTSEINLFITSNYNQKTCSITHPLVGMTCIAPFTDETYYRVRVLSVMETQNPDLTLVSKVNVLYVDYGNIDIIPTSSLIKMPQSFAKLPAQAICCALAQVMPLNITENWSTDSSEAFHNMVFCKELVCNPVYNDNLTPQIVDLYLMDSPTQTTLEDIKNSLDNKVSWILIKQGFAKLVTESSQAQIIYQVVKDLILFKPASPVKNNNGKIIRVPPGFSKSFVEQQVDNDLELHHNSLEMNKDATSLEFLAEMVSTSPETIQQSPASCSKLTMLDSDNCENPLSSSDLISNQTVLQNNSEELSQVTDLENKLVASNSQPVVSKSDNCPVTSVETAATSSSTDIDSNFNCPIETLPSELSEYLPIEDSQINSCKTSVSSDSASVNSKLDKNEFNAVMISHVESPSSFYVHHINKETSLLLERLIHDLKTEFSCLKPCQLTLLSNELTIQKGELCCVYFANEEAYYRGLIIDYKTDPSMGVLVKIFYIDFGNSEWLKSDVVFRLPESYSKIPSLAQHCTLAYIHSKGASIWSEEAKTVFRNLLKASDTYFIRIVADCSTFDAPSLENYEKAPVEVLMICHDAPESCSDNESNEKTEICLNYELIDLEHASLNVEKHENLDLTDWDPMSEDFDSRRNCYDVNTDDAEIATVGFKVKDESRICKFFRDGRACWLRERCPYKHIRLEKDCLTADKRITVCDAGLLSQMELPQVGSLVGVEVTAVSSPVQFYVVFPWGTESVKNLNSMPVCPNEEETLPDLQESLQKCYQKLPPRTEENLLWTLGELVVAKSPVDEQWYRARICDVDDTTNTVKVFFVDYGNVQWIAEKHIQPIKPEFIHLPHQAVECCLNGVAPTSADGLWNQEARNSFVKLVDGKVLVAHVIKIISGRLYIDLYDTLNKTDKKLSEELVRVGVVSKLKTKAKPSKNSNMHKEKTESISRVLLMPG